MTAPEEHMQLAAWLRNPWQKCDDTPRGPIPEWQAALMFEAANVIDGYSRSAVITQAAVAAAYEAAAQVVDPSSPAKSCTCQACNERKWCAQSIRALATPDQIAALAAVRAADQAEITRLRAVIAKDAVQMIDDQHKMHKAVEALRFYANGENWMINGPLDGNSGNYTGGPAKAVLAEIGGA